MCTCEQVLFCLSALQQQSVAGMPLCVVIRSQRLKLPCHSVDTPVDTSVVVRSQRLKLPCLSTKRSG
jgi:hypothetical protein